MPKHTLIALCALILSLPVHRATGHELPDGQAERAIQVVVFPDRVEVEYQFGMSAATMREALANHGHMAARDIPELETQFLETMSKLIPERLVLRLNDEVIKPSDVESTMIYKHHLPYACELTYPRNLSGGGTRLVLEDQNWSDWPGYYRLAIKGRDGVTIQKSNAEPLIVRAERIPVQQWTVEDQNGPMIQAMIGVESTDQPADVSSPKDRQHAQKSPALPRWIVIGVVLIVAAITTPFVLAKKKTRGRSAA